MRITMRLYAVGGVETSFKLQSFEYETFAFGGYYFRAMLYRTDDFARRA